MFTYHRSEPSTPDQIYSSALAKALRYGYALWIPEPQRRGEPQVGDVGFFDNGSFQRLVNLDLSDNAKAVTPPWEHPFEIVEAVPHGILEETRRTTPLIPPGIYRTTGVERNTISVSGQVAASPHVALTAEAQYVCTETHGALLHLKSGGDEETLLLDNLHFKRYILRNHSAWYAHAKHRMGHALNEEDLVVIKGLTKTSADWEVKAFSNAATKFSAALGGVVGSLVGISFRRNYEHSNINPIIVSRHGSSYGADHYHAPDQGLPVDAKKDQCIFMKCYKVRRRLLVIRHVKAGAGYHQLPGGGGTEGEEGVIVQGVQDVPEQTGALGLRLVHRPISQLDVLLDYMLEVTAASEVNAVVASDDDVASILNGTSVIDFASFLRKTRPPVTTKDQGGYLSILDVISDERERSLSPRTVSKRDLSAWPKLSLDGSVGLSTHRASMERGAFKAQPLEFKEYTFTEHTSPSLPPTCFSLSTERGLLAVVFLGIDYINVWRLPDGLLVQRLDPPSPHLNHNHFYSICISPTDDRALAGSANGTVLVWAVRTGHVLLCRKEYSHPVDTVSYTPDGAFFATACREEGCLKIWNAEAGTILHSIEFDASKGKIDHLSFSSQPERLYVDLHHSVFIYDAQSYTEIAAMEFGLEAEVDWAMSPQSDRLAIAPKNGVLKVCSTETGKELLAIDQPNPLSWPVAFSADGTEVLAVCDEDNSALVYGSQTGDLRRTYSLSEPIYTASFSPKGDYVAFGGVSGDIEVYDAKSTTFLVKFEGPRSEEGGESETHWLADGERFITFYTHGPVLMRSVRDALRLR